jgi:hypothetical protein
MDGLPTSCSRVFQAINHDLAKEVIISGTQNPLAVLASHGVIFQISREIVTVPQDPNPGPDHDPELNGLASVETVSYVSLGPGGQGKFEQTPQNSGQTLPSDLKQQVQNIATNCADYMDRLLNQLGSKFTAETFGDLFDRVGMNHIKIEHKEFERLGEPDAAGLAEYNPRRIFINTTVTAIARVTTFELLHHAANRGSFDDYALDNAVIALMDPGARRDPEKEKQLKGYKRASIAHKELNAKCFNLRKK